LALAAEGAAVALVGRTRSKLEIVAEEIEQRGSRSLAIACDVGDPEQIDSAVAATLEYFGQLDTLVNAAHTTFGPQLLLETTDEEIELLWSTGPRATLRFMRRCYPQLRGGGSIINFGSGAQMLARGIGVYAGMKDAIWAISRAAAVEWGPENIRVNVVAPFVESPSFQAVRARLGVDIDYFRALTPLRRIGDPEADLGRVVVFLAGQDASYVTGQLIMVDGGDAYHR
jgi:NAD(P)-dependent dehydrogenase (short-subunit alcohol dehydrogenase family)